jgi:hypothetical protein
MKQPVAKLLVPLAAAAILFRVTAQASGADASVPQTSENYFPSAA